MLQHGLVNVGERASCRGRFSFPADLAASWAATACFATLGEPRPFLAAFVAFFAAPCAALETPRVADALLIASISLLVMSCAE